MKTRQNGYFGAKSPLQWKIVRILLLRFNRRFLHEFHAKFHAALSRYKEKRVHCTRYKTPTFSLPFCAPLAQVAKILTYDI